MDQKQSEFSYAFPKTIPVMVGYLFLGTAYGILMRVSGFGLLWTAAISIFVYAGSLQYLGVTMLGSLVNPFAALMMSLMLNARHLFYGISMLGKYADVKCKPYLIFGLTDETFSVLCDEEVPDGINKDKVYFWVTVLDQSYWFTGSVIGAIAGSFITFDTTGLDFALTALFVAIFTDQWRKREGHLPALIGLVSSLICLNIFGQSNFIIPAMAMILVILGIRYRMQQRKEEK